MNTALNTGMCLWSVQHASDKVDVLNLLYASILFENEKPWPTMTHAMLKCLMPCNIWMCSSLEVSVLTSLAKLAARENDNRKRCMTLSERREEELQHNQSFQT